ncbi:MAG: FIST C domain protein [Deltaproteobacteria bacterium ADurb.Bin207]|nr:MAG: FIST C domain protein [Deltaproteobacteria bacterium ADurb.Bin207]
MDLVDTRAEARVCGQACWPPKGEKFRKCFSQRRRSSTVVDMVAAVSFEYVGNQPRDLRAVVEKCGQDLGGQVAGGLVFVSGSMARQIHEVANVLRTLSWAGPLVVAGGASVLTERGCYERTSACTGMVWKVGRCSGFVVDRDREELISDGLRSAARRTATPGNPIVLLASREAVGPTDLFDEKNPFDYPVVGGGTVGRPGAMLVADGRIKTGDLVGLALHQAGSAAVRVSSACRLLGPLMPVTAVDGALVLRIETQAALDVLRSQAAGVSGQRLVAVAVDLRGNLQEPARLMLRGIRGIHESRRAVMVSEEIRVGTRVAFAVIDAASAAADLEHTLRQMRRDLAGGMPRFGFYVDCAGRGSQLHGEEGVDLQMLRRFFPGLPIAGVASAFEIGPGARGAAVHLYSGVFCVVCAPS